MLILREDLVWMQTFLDGITLGGHEISDQNMTINQAKAWDHIFDLVDRGQFRFDQQAALAIHAIAGKEEALERGKVRSGYITIAGSDYEPPAPDELEAKWQEVQWQVESEEESYDQVITAFLQMARAQFFWDVNKRTGRFMMNGILLAYGFPIINVPAKRQQEFNTMMMDFYTSIDMRPMNAFLRSCLQPTIIKNFRLGLPIR